MNAKHRLKTLLTNLGLLVGSLVISFLLLEQGYRSFLFGWSSFSITRMNSLHGIGRAGMLRASEHKEIVYELKPNLQTYFKLTPFSTNSQGLRDQEYSLTKPPNTFRIAVVGDSFTLPSGVKIEDAFHSLLEDRLNRESRGTRYEVLNFGVGGYSLRQYVGVIKEKCSAYDPDLILIAYCARNDHEHPKWKFEREYVPKEIRNEFFSSFAFKGLAHVRAKSGPRRTRERAFVHALKKHHKRYLTKYLDALSAYHMETSVPIAVTLLDTRWARVPFVEKKLQKIGFAFLNATLPFRGQDPRSYFLNPLDSHPNSAANVIFADQIYDFLVTDGLVADSLVTDAM